MPHSEEPGNSRPLAEPRALRDRSPDIPFREPSNAQQILRRLTSKVSAGLAGAVPSLLTDSPDPDSALLLFDRFVAESPSEVVDLMEQHQHLAHYALVVFGYSRYLGETLLQNSDLLPLLLEDKSLDQSLSVEEFREALGDLRARSPDGDVSLVLARFKRREYVRIMLRDVLEIAPLAETTAEISALADVLIEAALGEAHKRLQARYPSVKPAPFAILSLGKLGGNELNYSSDVDLFYIFGNVEPDDTTISNREYFIRLAQQVTEILSSMTREGAVFRIDMRLRPQGNQGELAVSLAHAQHYYLTAAHDWERQALIKIRYSAGDPRLAREFIRSVQAHIYTQDTNLAAIRTALQARQRINDQRRKVVPRLPEEQSIDVKLDPGGIRDIEFLVQCLQRVYGGAESWLRSSGTLFSLQKLHDKRHIGGGDFQELSGTYVFLRHVEHRLQLRHGQQTHRLPNSPQELRILERSLETSSAEKDPAGFLQTIRRRMAAVAEICQRVIQQQGRAQPDGPPATYQLQSATAWAAPDQSNDEILHRLAVDSPALHAIATGDDLSPQARRNLFRFLSAALTGSERYAVVLRNAQAVPRALSLFEASDYLTQILIRHPEEIATLADLPQRSPVQGSGYLFDSSLGRTRSERDPVFAYVASSVAADSEKMALLRRHYRHRVFASGATDVIDSRAVYHSFAATTAAAEDAITAAFGVAGAPPDLAVLALGRLGSGEFDVLSDADLLFICEEGSDRVALTKCAERIVQALSAYTRDGMVFPVDTRLRPHGREGELLVSPAQLVVYAAQEAQPWEALMYTKLRYLAGSHNLAERAISATNTLFQRCSGDTSFAQAVREMRDKLEGAEKSLKTSAGAIYDIDFLSSYLLIRNRVHDKQGTLRDRLWRCAGHGLLPKPDAALLDHAGELFRTVDHVLRLVVGRASKGLRAGEHAWRTTQRLASNILQREFPEGLEAELEQKRAEVRALYMRWLST